MSVVKINRELLADTVDDLEARHTPCDTCWVSEGERRFCPTGQRILRARGVLERSP